MEEVGKGVDSGAGKEKIATCLYELLDWGLNSTGLNIFVAKGDHQEGHESCGQSTIFWSDGSGTVEKILFYYKNNQKPRW